MTQLKIFNVYDRDTDALMMAVEALDFDQAISRVLRTNLPFDKHRASNGLIVLREHDTETLIRAPYLFRDGHFLLLESLSLTQH
jgi:hypothetical protein